MTTYPQLDPQFRLDRLQPPTGPVRMVLDTDTYNEIDDQFAVAHALLSPEKLNLEAVYAAPFHNDRSTGPGEGMTKSYDEILRLLDRLNHPSENFAYRGSTEWLSDRSQPENSPAVQDLIERAKATPEDTPLYVVAIGAITNVASAIRLEPEIIHKIVIVWLGGQPHSFHTAREFNLQQDLAASQTIFDCGVPLVQIPCQGVASHLLTTVPELADALKGRNAISDFLFERFCEYHDDHFAWAKEVWDIAATSYLIDPAWVPTRIVPSPILTEQFTWAIAPAGRHPIAVAWTLHRNPIFRDLFIKLQNFEVSL